MEQVVGNILDLAGDAVDYQRNRGNTLSISKFLYPHLAKNKGASDLEIAGGSGSFRGDSAEGQFNAQRFDNWNATQIRVRDALKAGINPLAALGVSSNVQPTMSSGSYSGGNSSMGSSFMRQIGNIFRRRSRQEDESIGLDLEAKRIQNDILREELNHLRQPGLTSGNESMEQPPMGTDSMLFRVVYDLDGAPRLMVNQDITENDGDNAGYRSSLIQALKAGLINPVTGRVKSKQYLMFIDDMHRRHTGRPIMNLDRLYVSPAEFGLVAADELKGWLR